ncbi:TetR/AcrR family transcriptional regulator [Cellulomonas sp. PSBB021]|uniref:TetR/AcrR family transcriptional regulator n=1 Tax=Cellulomonas sp. PSBB021 TaxID=2003551 RepID=UPI000B8D5EC9|nr:TetR/AcrR family transcriptional regulator [Cellulomonas sp. PSBB021]ASR55678.1 hypothetical protein CBP52_11910 [Cellulomonas sp. PSBB021]
MSPRKDAARNHARLVEAAATVFRRDGVDAPLDTVAVQAGVGRATLYRHFPDRGSLLAAVLHDRIATLERYEAERGGPDLLVVEMCWYMADMHGLMTAIEASVIDDVHLAEVTERSNALLSRALAQAVATGVVREGTTLEDVLLVAVMAGALMTNPLTTEDDVSRALAICFNGLRRGAQTHELPAPELRAE